MKMTVYLVGIIIFGVIISGCSTSPHPDTITIGQEITHGNSKISVIDFKILEETNQLMVKLKLTNWQKPNVTIPLTDFPEGSYSN